MASGNQGQGRRNEGRDQGKNGGVGQSAHDVAQNVQQGLSRAGDRFQEGYEAALEELAHRYRRTEGTIARNPGGSVLLGFGLGFGIGLAITVLLTQREDSWADRYLPDSLRDLPDQIQKTRIPEQLGRAVRDAHLPDTLHQSFHHLADSLRDLPHTISRAVGR
jgi:hypothetical protein